MRIIYSYIHIMQILSPCTHLLCSGVTSARSAQEASHSNSQLASAEVPGTSPAATAVPDCTCDTGHRSPSSAEQLLHGSPVLLSPAPLSPPESTARRAPQPGELLHLLCRAAAPRASSGHRLRSLPSALGHPHTTGSFSY